MKIVSRGGHTLTSPGAVGKINEVTEDRLVVKRVNELLSAYNTVISAQPSDNLSYPSELTYGIRVSNNNNPDLFFSIHFNNAYNSYDGALGTELLVYPGSLATSYAQRIVNNLSALGLKNRGVKTSTELAELNSVNAPSMIIEVCFVEATGDVNVYRSATVEKVARAIANGIDNRISLNNVTEVSNRPIEVPKQTLVEYEGHIQSQGWQKSKKDGEMAGTTGKSKRLEAISIRYFGPGKVKYQAHIQNYGWTKECVAGEVAGTIGMALRMEAIKISLEGAEGKHIKYRVHIKSKGWLDWVQDGAVAGTTGQKLQIEAVEIKVE